MALLLQKTLPNGDVIKYWKWAQHNEGIVDGSTNHVLAGYDDKSDRENYYKQGIKNQVGFSQWKKGKGHPYDTKIKVTVDGEEWNDVKNIWDLLDKACYIAAQKSVPQTEGIDDDGNAIIKKDKEGNITETNEFANAEAC